MKFAHIGDLHIGKRVNGFSMLEDQRYILKQIIGVLQENKVDAVLMAGDIYDTPLPPIEAVRLFDEFLTHLVQLRIKIFIISGNHDSADRLAFAARLLEKNNVYIHSVFAGNIQPTTIEDKYGLVNIYMLPFIKPIQIRKIWQEEAEHILTYNDAVHFVIDKMELDKKQRNIIIAHQFITGAATSDSEELSVGGLDNISVDCFADFDYVALGHIHRPQKIIKDNIRYAGSPLKYSFSEASHKKTLPIIEIKEKNNMKISFIDLLPQHDLRKIKGLYKNITLKANYENTAINDYISVTLTDQEEIPDAIGKLRSIYPNIMKIDYDNRRTGINNVVDNANAALQKKPLDLMNEFYKLQNNRDLSSKQCDFAQKIIEEIWEEK